MLTQARLKELLSYDPLTGNFTNLKSGKGRKPVGTVVGSPHKDGYVTSMIDGKNYMHHRLAWLYVHGVLPEADTYHRDGNRANNRLKNLRPAERYQNCQNAATRSDNLSGATGVRQVGRRWRATVSVQGRHYHVGYFGDKAQAKQAYLDAKAKHHTFQPVART